MTSISSYSRSKSPLLPNIHHLFLQMYDSRRTSYSSSRSASTVSTSSMSSEAGSIRKQSLREMPSYRVEASKALNRRDDLKDLKKRLSSNRDLLNADHASKPWLKFRSISQKSFEDVKEESGQAFAVEEPNYDHAPLPPPRKSKISSTASDPAAILSPSAVMSANPRRAPKYSRTNNDDFYMYNY